MEGLKGVVIHLGDWAVENMALSVTERGAKFDLIVFYLKNGHAISEEDCAGLARGYTAKERAAQKKVLEKFFVLKDGFFYSDWCEKKLRETNETKQESEEVRDHSEQRRAAAKARWERERSKKSKKINATCNTDDAGCIDSAYANAMQNDADAYAKCNANAYANGMQNDANAMHTSNQYPVSSSNKEKDTEKAMHPQCTVHMQNDANTVADRDECDELFDQVPPMDEVPEDVKAQTERKPLDKPEQTKAEKKQSSRGQLQRLLAELEKDGIDEGLLSAYLDLRKKKRMGSFEGKPLALYRADCEKAGITIKQAMETSVKRGWVGAFAEGSNNFGRGGARKSADNWTGREKRESEREEYML